LLSSYIRCLDAEAESLKSQLDYLDHFMHYRNMPKRVQQRITDFYLLVCSHVGVSLVAAVQAALPSFLLRDLRLQIHHRRVRAVPALSSISFFPLKQMTMRLRATVALAGDVVCERGAVANELYWIDFGTVVITKMSLVTRRKLMNLSGAIRGATGGSGSICHTPSSLRKRSFDVNHRSAGSKTPNARSRRGSHSQRNKSFDANGRRKSHDINTEGADDEEHYISRDFGGCFGEEMLGYAADEVAETGGSTYEYNGEAHTNCHLFYLTKSSWTTLVDLFPDELGPISRQNVTTVSGAGGPTETDATAAKPVKRRMARCIARLRRQLTSSFTEGDRTAHAAARAANAARSPAGPPCRLSRSERLSRSVSPKRSLRLFSFSAREACASRSSRIQPSTPDKLRESSNVSSAHESERPPTERPRDEDTQTSTPVPSQTQQVQAAAHMQQPAGPPAGTLRRQLTPRLWAQPHQSERGGIGPRRQGSALSLLNGLHPSRRRQSGVRPSPSVTTPVP